MKGRIAFITYEYPPDTGKGGIGTYSIQISELLAANQFDVHVFAGSFSDKVDEEINKVNVHWVKCTCVGDFNTNVVECFSKIHEAENFDCIESPEINANAQFIKDKFSNLPLIVKIHAPNYLVESLKKEYLPFWNKARFTLGALKRGKLDLGYWKQYNKKADIDYKFALQADHIIAPTAIMKNWIVDNWGFSPEKIKVVSNPVAINPAFQNHQPQISFKKILFYGRLNVLKGMVTITKAMKIILHDNPSWQWIVIGDDGPGPDSSTTMKAWMQFQLSGVLDKVVFLPGLDYNEIPVYLRKSDIVVIPSLFESFSYVCAEAMTAGKAIVGSSQTGIESLLDNGVSGFLAHPLKTKEWISSIQKLIDSPALINSMGANASIAIQQRVANQNHIIDYYHSVMDTKNGLS